MKLRRFKAMAALVLLAASSAALACADVSCYPDWKLHAGNHSCENRAILAPGNDTRTNLLFLLRDRGGQGSAGLSYPAAGWDNAGFGQVFLDPYMQRAGFYPAAKPEGNAPAHSGTRCASFEAASAALFAAMETSKGLPMAERAALSGIRAASTTTCAGNAIRIEDTPAVTSKPGREFLGYIHAADAFYGGRWDEARQGFVALARAKVPWVKETAAYTLARAEFAAAQSGAFGEYGFYDPAKVDPAAVKRGLLAISGYLKAWPKGRYAASAQGLVRRGLWLAGDTSALGREYARLLATVPADRDAAADLVQEIDHKLLFNPAAKDAAPEGALLLAAVDLLQLRTELDEGGDVWQAPSLTADKLDAQAPRFKGQEALFSFLQANHAFYVAKDYRKVLSLLPDEAKQPAFSHLAFSRQVLRGQALAALGDRNEAGFWLELLGGATGLWQRPTVELGLAMSWERNGKLAMVFAKDSPITETMIRRELILHSAGPALLRGAVHDAARPQQERDLALFTLLYKQLSRGDYASFGLDRTLVRRDAATEGGLYHVVDQEVVPLGAFTRGRWSDGYPCPVIGDTARQLAANPQAVSARLCLGDFWRLNGFDLFDDPDKAPLKDELGGHANEFAGKPSPRAAIYSAVIADPKAKADDKAYALYRAVMCYAPSGANACGGKGVDQAQRKAWHDRLKSEFPASPWAKKLRYYW
jgi:hypothetical protein